MPEYLAPGVYVEEVSFRAKSIEGVSTSTAGFVGPARYGPFNGSPELVTSLAEFERVFGGLDQLTFEGEDETDNYLAHGVRAFFDNGGQRVYISRIYRAPEASSRPAASPPRHFTVDDLTAFAGCAWAEIHTTTGDLFLTARYPGTGGNFRVAFRFRVSDNVSALKTDPTVPGGTYTVLKGLTPYDLVWISTGAVTDKTAPGALYWAERFFDNSYKQDNWRLHPAAGSPITLNSVSGNAVVSAFASNQEVHRVTATVEVTFLDNDGNYERSEQWESLTFHSAHPQSLQQVFSAEPATRSLRLSIPFIFDDDDLNGPQVAQILLDALAQQANFPTATNLGSTTLQADQQTYEIRLQEGSDGPRPRASEYEGDDTDPQRKTGLKALEDIPDISIVAAPGHTVWAEGDSNANTNSLAVANLLITHCENMRYCIAVLDSQPGQALPDIRGYRSQLDSTRAAIYYPFVRILDPVTNTEINLPPSGFVAGIYARTDIQSGVHKSPANEVILDALGFEVLINKGQQDVLNPEGINVSRFFEGRGYRVWGARTITSDPEWKYVNVRRYFMYLERSIDIGTQWAVFENNGDALWANVRRTIEDFLYNEWKSGHLFGTTPKEAYFVRCDRTTMTQNDFDNGRLVCLIGVSPLRPAEFVIFRIGQKTADATS
ncbi:MAG TPA: phage tail sheath subtilisin-like domain-containing protein [Vicinamibacterales bacterium]|nr:phage tail sheath subtilisin-like domain-containing protein [Vicinamibacterales bacterium]